MPALGRKESFYLDLTRDAWGPLTARREVRQAAFVLVIGIICVIGGGYATLVAGDVTPFFAGIAFVAWSTSTLWQYRAAFNSWRRIGLVHLEFPEGTLATGELGTFELVIAPRRAGTVHAASLTLWCTDARGPAAIVPWNTGLAFDAAAPFPVLVAGQEARIPVLVALDPAAPGSWFDNPVRQWKALARLELTDGRVWTREYPVIVVPGAAALAAAAPPSGVVFVPLAPQGEGAPDDLHDIGPHVSGERVGE
jgi:hypothetical protein